MGKQTAQPKGLLDEEDGVEEVQLQINEDFAKRFEHNKRREELHRLQAKHPELARKIEREAIQRTTNARRDKDDDDVEDEDESTSEEEDDGDIPEETEAKIFETLLRIRQKDPAIYDSKVSFFKEEEEEEEEADNEDGVENGDEKSKKPLYLKDVLAKQALEHGPDLPSEDEDDDQPAEGRGQLRDAPAQAYDEEQKQLRKAFLSAADEAVDGEAGDGFGGILKKRQTTPIPDDEDDNEVGDAKPKKVGKKKVQKLVDTYFLGGNVTNGTEMSEADQFLRDFILNKGWVDKEDKGYVPAYDEVVADIDEEEDEQHLQQVDTFEAAYNFRYEEPGGATIVTHPRVVEGSIRKADDRRKKARDAKKERDKEALAAHEEELKRLKNLKKKEIEERLAKIAKVAGAQLAGEEEANDSNTHNKSKKGAKAAASAAAKAALRIDPSLLDGDFDPEEWDKQMAAAFDDEYYEGEDEDMDDLIGEDAEKELEELVGPLGYDDDDDVEGDDGTADGSEPAGFSALRKKLTKAASEDPMSEDVVEGDGINTETGAEAAAAARAELNRLLEEYYKLDYEGVAGGIKTRFKYREVPAETYGMNVEDILLASDKELNQVVGLKRIAPYREHGDGKQRPNYKALQGLRQDITNKQSKKLNRHKGPGRPRLEIEPAVPQIEIQPENAGNTANQPHGKQHNRQQEHGKDSKQHRQSNGHNQQQQTQPHGKHRNDRQKQKAELDPAEARKASYASLSLSKPGGHGKEKAVGQKRKGDDESAGPRGGQHGNGHKKQKTASDASAPAPPEPVVPLTGPDGQPLTKAQRKNMKRAMKRAAGKQTSQGDGQ